MPEGAGLEAANVAGALTSMHIDELVSNLAIGIAKGQMELDKVCMDIAQFMGDAQVAFGKRAGSDEPDLMSLIELGFTPNFYQFVDTILEVRVSVSTQYEESREYDTSRTAMHQDEYESQSRYSSSRSSGYSSRSGGYSWGGYWGWWGWGWGGGGGYNRSSYGSSSSSYGGSTSYKQKNITLNTVDAKFASTYNYAVEGSSLIKAKIVPVPPPQVFDEVVRAKFQERRDWEQRMRWQDQARSILTTTANTAGSIKNDKNGLAYTPQGSFDKTNAETAQNSVLNLQDEYNRMTIDNWAVITGGVQLREDADNTLNTINRNAQKLVDLFADTSPAVSDLQLVIDALKNDLETFKGKIQELLDKLPEEETETTETPLPQEPGSVDDTELEQ
jgi:hypothetical protein